jgi:hypothetical protein
MGKCLPDGYTKLVFWGMLWLSLKIQDGIWPSTSWTGMEGAVKSCELLSLLFPDTLSFQI